MHVSSRLLNWGAFLIALGAVPLAVQWNVMNVEAAGQLLRWWPVLLIGIGFGIILRHTPFAIVGGLLSAAILGVLGGALLAGGVGSAGGACAGGPQAGGEVLTRSGTFGGVSGAVDLDLTCTRLTLTSQPGTAWAIEASHASDRPPTLDETPDRIALRSDRGGTFPFFGSSVRRDWQVSLPEAPPLSLSLTLNASTASLDLGNSNLRALNGTFNAADVRIDMESVSAEDGTMGMTFNASSGTIVLPAASLRANVTINASSLTLCAAPSVGLRFAQQQTLGSTNFEPAGLTRVGEDWQTPGFDSAVARIDLRINSNVSSITLDRSGGCP